METVCPGGGITPGDSSETGRPASERAQTRCGTPVTSRRWMETGQPVGSHVVVGGALGNAGGNRG